MESDRVNLLQRLADICRDGEREFIAAAERLSDPKAQERFRLAATRYAAAATEIDDAIEDLGGYPLTTGTFAGVQRFALARVKSFFVEADDAALISSCERSEEFAEDCYEEAMDVELPEFVSLMLKRHYVEMLEDRDALRKLRGVPA